MKTSNVRTALLQLAIVIATIAASWHAGARIAQAQAPALPDWMREYMAGCPGCTLRFTASGWMVSRPGMFGQYLLNEASHMAAAVGADPASGVSLVSPGNVGVAFYDALPTAQDAVQESVQVIRQRSAPYYEFQPPASYLVEQKFIERAKQAAAAAITAAAHAATATESSLFLLVQSPLLWRAMRGNVIGPVVN